MDIAKLRKELMLAPMKSNFTFSRDEVLELLAANELTTIPVDAQKSANVDDKPCPYCTSDIKFMRDTYFCMTCPGCVARMNDE